MSGRELPKDVRTDLLTLSKDNAVAVSRHLVMAARLLPADPAGSYAHAVAARARAGRLGVVREAVGLAAYATGDLPEALRELRTARRLSGAAGQLALIAECERRLGRPERVLAVASSESARSISASGRAGLAIVESRARLDLGDPDAAVVVLRRQLSLTPPGAPWRQGLLAALGDAQRRTAQPADPASGPDGAPG